MDSDLPPALTFTGGLGEFTPYRIAAPLIALFFILYAWNHVWRGSKTIWEAVLWTFFWGSVAFVVLFPSGVRFLTIWTGIRDQENAIFAIALGILLFIVFHMLIRIEKLQKRITDLVRHEAIEKADLDHPVRSE